MKHDTHAIYQRGASSVRNTCHTLPDGSLIPAYTQEPMDAYLARVNGELGDGPPRFEVLPWDVVMPLIEEAQDVAYVTAWEEIDEETWMERLEVLPPEKWQTVSGVEFFRICERLTSNITQHLARLGDRYFSRNCRTSTAYSELAGEVYGMAKNNQI